MRFVTTDAAERDADEIWMWIAADSPRAATRILDQFEEIAAILARFPGAGVARPELGDALRSFPVSSYVIFYRPIDDGVEIVRVLHGRRDITSEDF